MNRKLTHFSRKVGLPASQQTKNRYRVKSLLLYEPAQIHLFFDHRGSLVELPPMVTSLSRSKADEVVKKIHAFDPLSLTVIDSLV